MTGSASQTQKISQSSKGQGTKRIILDSAVRLAGTLGIEGLTIGALSPKQALEKVGTEYEAFTKFTIDDFSDPTNAESTVEIKGFNDPLIHTGKMKSSVKFKIVRKR